MGDHQGTPSAVNLCPFVSVDLNLWPTIYIAFIVLIWRKLNLTKTQDQPLHFWMVLLNSAPTTPTAPVTKYHASCVDTRRTRAGCATAPVDQTSDQTAPTAAIWLVPWNWWSAQSVQSTPTIHFLHLYIIPETRRQNININICSIELKWDGKILTYDMITRWGEYE